MKSVGEVAIVVGADLGPMNRELRRAEGGLKSFERSAMSMGSFIGSAMGKVTVGVSAAAVGMAALTRRSMDNIDALAKQARAAGVSVSAFQAMSLVANEAGVETDALSKMVVKLQDNIVQLGKGASAQVAAFQTLGLSMSDLAGLSADEQFAKVAEAISKIKDPAERTAAALDAFGKSGAAALNMVDGYADAVASAADFQRKLGLAISDTDAKNIEKANDAVGRMWMAFEGLGNVMASSIAPSMENFANRMVSVIEQLFSAEAALDRFFGTAEKAKAVLGDEMYAQLTRTGESIEENAENLALLAAAYEPVTDAALTASNSILGVVNTLDAWGYDEQSNGLASIASEMRQLSTDFREGLIPAEEYQTRLDELVAQAQSLFSELDATDALSFGNVISEIGALGVALSAAAAIAAKLHNLISMGTAVDFGAIPDDRAAAISESRASQGGFIGETITSSPRPQRPGVDSYGDWLDASTGGGGGGGKGGGGLADKFARRLEIIVDALKTEQEVIQEWYEESRSMIEQASEDELAALGGKHEALERLEQEHQDRLGAIRQMANDSSLAMVLGAGEEILSAVGQTNKKALKVAKVFGAAQALISTYQGAAEALKLPFPKNLSAAAAVIAKGIGFVNAIKGVNDSGGGSVSRGGGGGGAAAAQQAPVQTMNFTVQNDPFGYGERFARSLAEQMNAARRNGSQIVATVTST